MTKGVSGLGRRTLNKKSPEKPGWFKALSGFVLITWSVSFTFLGIWSAIGITTRESLCNISIAWLFSGSRCRP